MAEQNNAIRSCLCRHGNDAPGMAKEIINSMATSSPEYAALETQLRQKMPQPEADNFMRSAPRIEILKAAVAALPATREERIQKLRNAAGLNNRQRIIHPRK